MEVTSLNLAPRTQWRTRMFLRCVLAALVLVACPWPALALDPALRLDQYHHRVYSPLGSTPTESWAIAQTDDGYLWDGTSAGLFRFDGMVFEPMPSLGGHSISNLPVQTLISEPGGGLWIGFAGGAGFGHFKGGRYTAYGPEKGWTNLVSGAIDSDGTLWASIDDHLVRVDHSGPHVLDASWGLPNTGIQEVVIDKAGTVWVSVTGKKDLMYLARGERRFLWTGQTTGGVRLAAAPDGTIYVCGETGLWAVVTHEGRPTKVVQISARTFSRILVDRDGGLFAWNFKKVFHIGNARRLFDPGGEKLLLSDSFRLQQDEGLSSPLLISMREDSEGNLWIASTGTLERFSNSPFTSIRLPAESFTFSVVPGEGGTVWAANWDSRVLKIEGRTKITEFNDIGPAIECLYRDPAGFIWAASPAGLWRTDAHQRFVRVPIPSELLQPWVANMTLDASGNLWLTTGGVVGHLVRGSLNAGGWHRLTASEGFGDLPMAHAMMTDSSGRVWLGRGHTIIRVEQGIPRALAGLAAALQVGAILTFAERDQRIWVGGLDGVALVRDDRVLKLKVRDGTGFNRVTGIVETPQGDLWVRGADDVWRISAAELQRALAEERAEVAAEHFDALDGLGGLALNAKPTMTPTSDGLIWFGTRQGLAWIDPSRARPPAPEPVRHIKSVLVDGRQFAAAQTLTLPALSHRLEIAYTAIDLAYPERIQFRYKLDGFDPDWQSAGTRRVAYYNDLPPGDYRFRVSSTNRNGLWQDQGEASLEIHAAPAWFQTVLFKLACVLLAVVVATLLYRLRMRRLAAHMRRRMDQQLTERDRIATARQAERDRIARELHDTLLQGFYGLIWKFQSLADRVPHADPLRSSIDEALKGADRVLLEGRDRVLDLRVGASAAVALIDQLEQAVDEINAMPSITFVPSSEGDDVDLLPGVHAEVLAVAVEALRNAYRHAGATQVELHLLYGSDEFRLDVLDNGSGIPNRMLVDGKANHWGLAGMKERAGAIGATLEFLEREGGGTVVTLQLKALLAYGPRMAPVSASSP